MIAITNQTIGRIIKDQRIKKGMTQSELAGLLSCSKSYIMQIEKAKVPVSAYYMGKLCIHLDLPFAFALKHFNRALYEETLKEYNKGLADANDAK